MCIFKRSQKKKNWVVAYDVRIDMCSLRGFAVDNTAPNWKWKRSSARVSSRSILQRARLASDQMKSNSTKFSRLGTSYFRPFASERGKGRVDRRISGRMLRDITNRRASWPRSVLWRIDSLYPWDLLTTPFLPIRIQLKGRAHFSVFSGMQASPARYSWFEAFECFAAMYSLTSANSGSQTSLLIALCKITFT